jgi:hypothetical protein
MRAVLERTSRTYRRTARAVTVRSATAMADDAGMTTAEYAVGTVAACGFGSILYQILTSDGISGLLSGLIEKALSLVFG